MILPPQSECVVPAKMDGQWKHKPRWGIMEAGTRNKEAESALEGLLVARTLVDLHQPTTVVRMMNLSGPLTSCRAVLETTVILPPQSECVVPAKMDGQWKHKPRWGIMEAGTRNKEAESALEGLLVARTLVDLHQPTTVVRMMNLSGQKRKVKKGTEIARCEQVASVVLQQKEIAKAESEMLHLPEHLKE